MILFSRRIFAMSIALAATVSSPSHAQASSYPDKPVRMIVSYAAGNVSDVLGRLVAERLAAKWGQPVIVENRPGIGGSLGASVVSKADPDGYTLLFTAVAAMAVNPQISANVHYDPFKDFTPVGLIAFSPLVLVTHPSVQAKTLPELIAYTKAHPGTLNWGTPGLGTISHLSLSYFNLHGGLAVEHVPYKASSALMTDLIGGRIQIADEGWPVVLPHIKSGAVRAIAVSSLKRSRPMPDLPTAAETFPNFEGGAWSAVMAPAGLPPAITNKINADIQTIVTTPEMNKRLLDFGMDPLVGSPAFFADKLRSDYQRYGELARQIGLKIK